ncbi:endonuclease domain-containing protein [Streptomyces hydrogenans]|uniref:endonuclease domain-containing protein n=1 Tax=Streptomyces hydrogenans TaxID=1873719 RepID=UPI00380D5A35
MTPDELDRLVLAVAVAERYTFVSGIRYGRCTATTARGTQCQHNGTSGPEDGPIVCGGHLRGERRKARKEAEHAAKVRDFLALDPTRQAAILRRTRFFVTASPACWSWEIPADMATSQPSIPAVGKGDEFISERTAEMLRRAYEDPEARQSALLNEWQAGRCAICEDSGSELVTDHDHATGLVRGMLCRSCNTREGFSYAPGRQSVFAAYRERPPVALLGFTIRYFDPFTGEYAEPVPPRPADYDPWAPENNALTGLL